MKKRRQKGRGGISDGGFSLIELIVTILISSVVIASALGFLTTGLKHYRNVNSETMLQMESQTAELFITELFQEATDFKMLDSTIDTEISYAVEVQREGKAYVLALIGDELWFSEVTAAGADGDKLNELKTNGRKKAFLAEYVTDFQIGSESFAKAVSENHGLVVVDLIFKIDDKEYYKNSLISLRNTKKN
ncbi:MAG: prepilin-type N-terminal cleavage/methylation domain-containing protein [Lachnospiraceae bacterium]|nr:prepilin-type N-terminal cleavage/methylation domain-containing protein [Lachnospiraceae bacterium]